MFAERYMINYLLHFHIFQTTRDSARWGQLDSSSLKALQKSLRLDDFICMSCSWM